MGVNFLMIEEIMLCSQFSLYLPSYPCFCPSTSSPNASFFRGCSSTIICFQATGMLPKNERFQRHHCAPESHCVELGFGGLLGSYIHKVTCLPSHIWTSLPVGLIPLSLGGRFMLSFCKGNMSSLWAFLVLHGNSGLRHYPTGDAWVPTSVHQHSVTCIT